MQSLHIISHDWEVAAMVSAVWIIYVGDRMLDALRLPVLSGLSDRHRFYAQHGRAILGAFTPILFTTAWISLVRLGNATRFAGLVMTAVVSLYFLAIHGIPHRVKKWFPKEIAAGGIFAVGAAIPTWMHAAGERKVLIPEVILFAGLCGLNCIAIECWEHNRGGRRWEGKPYWLIRLADAHIARIASILIVGGVSTGIFMVQKESHADIFAASVFSLLILIAIEWRSNRLSPQALRVLADAALLTPLLFLLKGAL
jgi:hypothetical protein